MELTLVGRKLVITSLTLAAGGPLPTGGAGGAAAASAAMLLGQVMAPWVARATRTDDAVKGRRSR